MHKMPKLKPIAWVGSALKDMRAMPEEVQDTFGFALYMAQCGGKHPDAKPLKGFSGAGVLEIVEDYNSDTYAPFIPSDLLMLCMSCMFSRRSQRRVSPRRRKRSPGSRPV